MKVCHITTVHPAQDARIFHRMCRALARRNINVAVIAPESFSSERHLRPSPFNDGLGRAPRLRRSGIALRAALAENADVYHFHDPELIPMALALKTLRLNKAVVYDVHEDYPSMMRDKYWLPRWSRPAAALGARLANRIAGKFLDGVVVADTGVAADFMRTAADKTLVYYNFPSLDLFTPLSMPVAKPDADLVYLGGLSERAGIFVLFDALKILAGNGVKPSVRLAGYTDGEKGLAAIDAALRQLDLSEQVEFHGRLAHNEVPAWLRSGRIGLVLLQAVPKFMKNIPSKMFEYWACGLPVLASDLPPARQFLVEGQNGYLFAASSAVHLAERLAYLLQDTAECESLGRAGRRMVEAEWNNERQIDGLISFYGKLLQKCSRGRQRAVAHGVPPNALTSTKELPADLPER
ncbi:MAG: glycosyltransferase family 4 protein [Candidatus Binatia bacterium]